MAAIAFDTLKCARRLKAAGYTDKQAEVQAEIMAEAFVYNIGTLITKDYLDARFAEQEAKIDTRFSEQGARIDVQFADMKGQFRLIYWMLAVVITSSVIPLLTTFWGQL